MSIPRFTIDGTLADAAWLMIDQRPTPDPAGSYGLLDEFGSDTGENGWNALVAVTAKWLAEDAGVDEQFLGRLRQETGGTEDFLVWVRVDHSHLFPVAWGHDEGLRSGTDAINIRWDSAKAAATQQGTR